MEFRLLKLTPKTLNMKHSISVKPQHFTELEKMDDLQQSLEIIEQKLDSEIVAKQNTIDRQEQEIQRLHDLVEEKNKIIFEMNLKLVDCIKNSEGSRQLINKLLNDIERLQQDVEWYKRTYETRSLLGTLTEKLKPRRKK
jgi:predicted RNase H-like nuclease (RuvC/YqgF family)